MDSSMLAKKAELGSKKSCPFLGKRIDKEVPAFSPKAHPVQSGLA
jgi:hypothetical protein